MEYEQLLKDHESIENKIKDRIIYIADRFALARGAVPCDKRSFSVDAKLLKVYDFNDTFKVDLRFFISDEELDKECSKLEELHREECRKASLYTDAILKEQEARERALLAKLKEKYES